MGPGLGLRTEQVSVGDRLHTLVSVLIVRSWAVSLWLVAVPLNFLLHIWGWESGICVEVGEQLKSHSFLLHVSL